MTSDVYSPGDKFRLFYDRILQAGDQQAHHADNRIAINLLDDKYGAQFNYSFHKNFPDASLAERVFHFVEFLEESNQLDEAFRYFDINKDDDRENKPLHLPPALLELCQVELTGKQMAKLNKIVLNNCQGEWQLACVVRTAGNVRAKDISQFYSPQFWGDIVETVVGLAVEQDWLLKLQMAVNKYVPDQPIKYFYVPEPRKNLLKRLAKKFYAFSIENPESEQDEIVKLIEQIKTNYDWRSLKRMFDTVLKKDLDELTGFEEEVIEIVDRANNGGWSKDLIAAAYEERPYDPAIRALNSSEEWALVDLKLALLSCYDRQSLKNLLTEKLNKKWHEKSNMERFVFDVTIHAEKNGWLIALLDDLCRDNQEDAQSERFYYELYPEIILFNTIIYHVRPDKLYPILLEIDKRYEVLIVEPMDSYVDIVAQIIADAREEQWLSAFIQKGYDENSTVKQFQKLYEYGRKSGQPNDRERIHGLFLSSFGHSELKKLVRHHFSRDLEEISLAGDLDKVVFDLLEASEKEGWTNQLLLAAAEGRPAVSEWQSVVAALPVDGG